RPARAVMTALLLTVLPGCLGDQAGSKAWLRRLSPFQGVSGPDVVNLQVALIQVPYADFARYRDLWTFLDEQAVQMEKQGELEEAQCCLGVAPSLDENGGVRLSVTPKVRHASSSKLPWRPRSDRAGWSLNFQQPVEEFPEAGFEVPINPGQYLVVGARVDRPG